MYILGFMKKKNTGKNKLRTKIIIVDFVHKDAYKFPSFYLNQNKSFGHSKTDSCNFCLFVIYIKKVDYAEFLT